ncbi:unnamed protein product, partial [Schistosoma turkestanicum]
SFGILIALLIATVKKISERYPLNDVFVIFYVRIIIPDISTVFYESKNAVCD